MQLSEFLTVWPEVCARIPSREIYFTTTSGGMSVLFKFWLFELRITLLPTRSNHWPLIIISTNSYEIFKYLVNCIWNYLQNIFRFTRQHSSRSKIWRTQWISSKIWKKKNTTKIWKSSWGLGGRVPTRTIPWLFLAPSLSHNHNNERGEGWRCYIQLPLLGWSRVRTPVRVSHYCSVVCHGHPDLQPPSQTTPPWCNIQPSYTPPPHHCWKKILRGQWHLKGGRGGYIDWGKDGCVIIIG